MGRQGREGSGWDVEFCSQVMLDSVEYGDQTAHDAVGVALLGVAGFAVLVAAVDEADAREVAHAGHDGGEAVAAGPEPVVAGGVAEDEHQAHHYAQ